MDMVAVIPARAGSKRVPGKNTRELGGRPLIAWTIRTALEAGLDDVFVSTDDEKTAGIARAYGAVPVARSRELATDKASVVPAVIELLDHFENDGDVIDSVLLLQPTSPFRSVDTIKRAVSLFRESRGDSVVSVSLVKEHPSWCKKIEDGALVPLLSDNDGSMLRSQDLDDVYCLNGLIYLSTSRSLRRQETFYSETTRPLIVRSEREALDIDTEHDWMVAESLAERQ